MSVPINHLCTPRHIQSHDSCFEAPAEEKLAHYRYTSGISFLKAPGTRTMEEHDHVSVRISSSID